MMKNRFQYIIAISLLFVYSLNMSSAVQDFLWNSLSNHSENNKAADKTAKDNTSSYYAFQDLEPLDNYTSGFEIDFENDHSSIAFTNHKSLELLKDSKDRSYLKKGKLIIPSLSSHTLIFPFHDFI